MAQLRVLTNHLLVRIKKQKEEVVNGLIIPHSNISMHIDAVVEGVGEKVVGISEGETVIIPSYCGLELTFEKVEYKVIADHDVMAVIKN